MSQGQQGPALGASAEADAGACWPHSVEHGRARERERLLARLRTVIVPGLEQLDDPTSDPAELIAIADRQAQRLRAELERPQESGDLLGLGLTLDRELEEEREWIRGHLHDTALQILEFIAGDGFGTGLSAAKIAGLAGGAARDLHRWIDSVDEPLAAELLPELRLVTEQARTLDPRVELVVGRIGTPPTGEQVSALAGAVREAVTNARKHAQASHVVVRVETALDGRTAVTVTDDGVGIDLDRALSGTGLGVKGSIVGRMKRAGGSASVQDAPGGGTLVRLVTSSSTQGG